MKQAPAFAAFIACLLPAACQMPGEDRGCACTAEYRMNACVTLDGSRDIPAGTRLYRHHGGVKDSLVGGTGNPPHGTGNCFGESAGPYRIEVWKDGAKVAERNIDSVRTVDCCHHADTTVDFNL